MIGLRFMGSPLGLYRLSKAERLMTLAAVLPLSNANEGEASAPASSPPPVGVESGVWERLQPFRVD